MKRSSKYILGGVGLLAVVILGIVVYGAYSIYSSLRSFGIGREMPEAIKEARVTVGGEFLNRSEFFKLEHEGWLKTIGDSTKIADEKERERLINSRTAAPIYNFADLKVFGNEIVAAGEFGAFVFDLNGTLKRHVTFEPGTDRVKIGPIEHDIQSSNLENLTIVRLDKERIGFLSWGLSAGLRVLDSDGNEVWTTAQETLNLGRVSEESDEEWEKRSYVMEAAVGDLDGDGVSEYIVAKKNDGIRAFDRSGNEKWFYEDNFPNKKLEVFDLDGDGRNELILVGKSVLDGNGKTIRDNIKSKGDTHLLSETKDRGFEVASIDISESRVIYQLEDGKEQFSADAPLSRIEVPAERVEIPGHPEMSYTNDSENVAFPKAALVTLRKGEPKYIAVIASFIGFPRANFYVYDQKGKLVYHELLPEDAETIAALPSEGGVDSILIGGKDTIWKYSVK